MDGLRESVNIVDDREVSLEEDFITIVGFHNELRIEPKPTHRIYMEMGSFFVLLATIFNIHQPTDDLIEYLNEKESTVNYLMHLVVHWQHLQIGYYSRPQTTESQFNHANKIIR